MALHMIEATTLNRYDRDKIIAYQCREPKRTNHAGRTWDSTSFFLRRGVEELELTAHFDTSWGRYWYFEWKDQWYKVSFMRGQWHPVRAHRFGFDIVDDDSTLGPKLRLVRIT